MKRAIRDPIFVALALFGSLLTIALTIQTRSNEEAAANRWLAERAEVIALATEETVDNTMTELKAVAAFLGASDSMNQERFDRFVGGMDMNPGVIGIGYVAVVDPTALEGFLAEARRDVPSFELLAFDGKGGVTPNYSPRPAYYPLRFVHGGPFMDVVVSQTPIDSQIDALGFDVATEPLWIDAFEQAITATEPSVSDLVAIGGLFEEQAFSATYPIRNSAGELVGILIAPGLESLLTNDLGVAITSNVNWAVDNIAPGTVESDWPVWRRDLDLVGTTWTLTVTPTDEARRDLSSRGYLFVLAVGILLTAALATTARQIRLRRHEHTKVARLHRQSEDKDRFLATVSHELRTPLTVVIGLAAELSQNGHSFDAAEHAELLGLIEEHGQEASAIVEDLLVAARSDIDKIVVNNETVDLRQTIELSLTTSTMEDVPVLGDCRPVTADPSRVRQILRNLLTNAARYGGAHVEIRLSHNSTMGVITVADSGDPIPPDREQAIFDPYVSAHEGGSQIGSIGLGLFISQKLARLMGGDLTYRHDGTHGLFSLSLPLAEDVVASVS
jgi:signal transduction histidine kinase